MQLNFLIFNLVITYKLLCSILYFPIFLIIRLTRIANEELSFQLFDDWSFY